MKETKTITINCLVVQWGNKYLGISKELGLVEEADTPDKAAEMLNDGIIATIEAILKTNRDIEKNLAVQPTLKYLLIFYIAPIIASIRRGFLFQFPKSVPLSIRELHA